MGADILGWRNCPLQLELEPQGFLAKIKLRVYRQVFEVQVPAEERATVRLTVRVNHRPDREIGYGEIVSELDDFERGIPECATCPLSGGKVLGCYRYVTFPIDDVFEPLVFDFFIAQSRVERSPAWQIGQNVIPRVAGSGTPWHARRGINDEAGALAMLPRPLEAAVGAQVEWQRVDSAQLMQALFTSLESAGPLHAYAAFWAEFLPYARARVSFASSQTLNEIAEMEPLYRAASLMARTGRCAVLVDA